MITASNAAWLEVLRRAIEGPNSVGAVYPALMGLETDSDAAMLVSLSQKTCCGRQAAAVGEALSPDLFAMSRKIEEQSSAASN